jgi:hypothetical protein
MSIIEDIRDEIQRLRKEIFGEAERVEIEKVKEERGNVYINIAYIRYTGDITVSHDSFFIWFSGFDERKMKFEHMYVLVKVNDKPIFERGDVIQVEIDLLFENPQVNWRGGSKRGGSLVLGYTGKVSIETRKNPEGLIVYIRGSDL